MDTLADVRKRHIALMRTTVAILGNVLEPVTQERATTLRDANDGAKGWTVLEVVCHLRDFDGFFYDRTVMMLEQEHPQLPSYDHEALAIERNYNGQQLRDAYEDLRQSRQRFVAFFQALTDAQWERAGIHPERGHFTMTDAVMQVGLHDATHLEQITRILTQP